MPPEIFSEMNLLAAVHELALRDPDLAMVVERYGPPPLWARPPGFPTLIHIILEQQVSLASALGLRAPESRRRPALPANVPRAG
jgi:DNA-3-methyladenine glycosylase II